MKSPTRSRGARKDRAPKVIKVRNAECPVHDGPVYWDGRRLLCPACERYRPTTSPGGSTNG